MPPSTYGVSPEKELVLACARTRMTPRGAERIRALAAGGIDWDLLLMAAAENSVLPLLASQLPALAGDLFQNEQLERLKSGARAAGIKSLQLSAELIRVIEALRGAEILALPYKGPVVAVQAYGDLALREFEDLDIILPQRDMARASEVMRGLGYEAKFPWIFSAEALVPGEYNFFDRARRVIVELHTELTLRHFPVAPNLDELARDGASVAIGGHNVATFGMEDTLVLLCVHGTKDFWERISWVADVAEFVQRNELDWQRVVRRAYAWKAERMLWLGLTLAARLLDAPVPAEIWKRIEDDAVALAVAREIGDRLVARSVRVRGAAESFHFRRQMIAGGLDSWGYGLKLATAPAEEDWMMVKLPRALAPLYVVLRPLRLFRKYRGS
jgi:hypothetical protein